MQSLSWHAAFARFARRITVPLGLGLTLATIAFAQDDPASNEYRVTLFPSHPIKGNMTGFGYLGYVANPDKNYTTYYVGWPGVTYTPNKVAQYWGGAFYTYTNNEISADKLEVRPFLGLKLFLPNDRKMNLYNFTRYEYRAIQDRTTHDWNGIHRVRTRFGVEAPLGSREHAWKPGATYGIADAEPFYRFDRHTIDPLRWRVGLGHVFENRVRVEFIYHAQYTRVGADSPLEYTDNIWRLNIKIGLKQGLLERTLEPGIDD